MDRRRVMCIHRRFFIVVVTVFASFPSTASESNLLTRAIEHFYQGDIPSSVRLFERVADSTSATGEETGVARASLVRLYRTIGRYDDALALLAADAPDRVTILQQAGRYHEAISAFEDLRRSNDAFPGAALSAARAAEGLGEYDAAEAFLQVVFRESPVPAHAYQTLGDLHLARNRYEDAVDAFRTSRRLEPNLTATLFPEAQALYGLSRFAEARSLLQRARSARPHEHEIATLLTRVESRAPELNVAEERERVARRETRDAPRVLDFPADIETIPTIRIGLIEAVNEIWLKTGSDWHIAGEPAIQGSRGDVIQLLSSSTDIRIRVNDTEVDHSRRGGDWISIEQSDTHATLLIFDLEHSAGQFSAGIEDRAYRGTLSFGRPPGAGRVGFTVVNELDVESYLYSVVPSEIPAWWPDAALEAQAIAARSYTFAASRSRYQSRGFDLLGSVASAFYRGVGGESPRTTRAVNATRGQVLRTGSGAILSAVYSANNAGHTDSAVDVWGYASALVGVADPQLGENPWYRSPSELTAWIQARPETYSSVAPFSYWNAYRWELHVDVEDLTRRNPGIGRITALIPEGRSPAGRVRHVRLIGTDGSRTVSGDAIRSRLGGLRSNLFMVEPVYDADGRTTRFVFSGAGWGHGVGMDQTGAAGMAQHGFTSAQILDHYYPLAEISVYY
ncbi:MAG: SpoIID/LytB domain-containing protein [Spirochaetaceae bacterium]|nr:MAG: SpoIID/LytB domain-containing protein [Spirochaetaceae bacterium]